jgi:hypothetical protein
VLIIRGNGPLGLHCCQLQDILTLFSTVAACRIEKVDMARMRQSSDALAEPDVVEPKPVVAAVRKTPHLGRLDTGILVDRTMMP